MIKIYLVIVIFTIIILFISNTILIPTNTNSTHTSPQGSPFAPLGFMVTAYFHDPDYFKIFHKEHTGIDLIPSPYTSSPIIHATISGIGYIYNETCSGEAVIIKNDSYIAYFGHIAKALISSQETIHFGDPIAIMGESGQKGICITGAHVHYQLYKKENGVFTLINPLSYLN